MQKCFAWWSSLKIHSDLANIFCRWLKKNIKTIQVFSLFVLNRGAMNHFWSISGSLFSSVAAPLQVGTPAHLKKSGKEKLLSVLWEMRRLHLLIHTEQPKKKKGCILIHLALIDLWCDFWHTHATLCNIDAETTYWSAQSWSVWLDGEIVLKGDYN